MTTKKQAKKPSSIETAALEYEKHIERKLSLEERLTFMEGYTRGFDRAVNIIQRTFDDVRQTLNS